MTLSVDNECEILLPVKLPVNSAFLHTIYLTYFTDRLCLIQYGKWQFKIVFCTWLVFRQTIEMYATILVQAIECLFRNGSMKPKKALPLRTPTIIFIAIHS